MDDEKRHQREEIGEIMRVCSFTHPTIKNLQTDHRAGANHIITRVSQITKIDCNKVSVHISLLCAPLREMTLVWGTIMHFYSCIMVDSGAREEAELYLLGSRESSTAFLVDGASGASSNLFSAPPQSLSSRQFTFLTQHHNTIIVNSFIMPLDVSGGAEPEKKWERNTWSAKNVS